MGPSPGPNPVAARYVSFLVLRRVDFVKEFLEFQAKNAILVSDFTTGAVKDHAADIHRHQGRGFYASKGQRTTAI